MAQGFLGARVDSRVELLSVVQSLHGYKLITQKDSSYRRNLNQYFAPYRSHSAVKVFGEMSADFNYDAPPTAMLHLSEPPDLDMQLPFSEDLEQRAGGKERLVYFIHLLRDFARETQFMSWLEMNKPVLLPMVNRVSRQIQTCNAVHTVEQYFGLRQRSYSVILTPLLANNAFGLSIERPDNSCDVCVIIGTTEVAVAGIVFSFGVPVSCALLWHEVSHSLVNPITARFREEIQRYQGLYVPIAKRMARLAYTSWETCVNEHIVRAVSSRLTHREYGNMRGQLSLWVEKMRGFRYVDALCTRLEKYESQRDQYPTFGDFYPQLIDVFAELSEDRPTLQR